jgi:hypothetical protein
MDCILLLICELAVHVAFIILLKEVPENIIFQFGYECLKCWITLVFMDEGIYSASKNCSNVLNILIVL